MKRVAIFLHGGLGGGHHDQGFPALESLVAGLGEHYTITAFSAYKPEKARDTFRIIAAPQWLPQGPLRWIWLISAFYWQHIRRPFHLLHGIWALPGGQVARWLAKRVKLPYLVTFMGGESAYLPQVPYGNLVDPKQRATILAQYHEADGLALGSQYAQTKLNEQQSPPHRAPEVIPLGIDIEQFEFRQRAPLAPPYKLLYVGNLTPIKAPLMLMKGVARFLESHDATLTVLGGDYHNGEVHALVKELGIEDRVVFAGEIPYDEVPHHIQEADILVHGSLHEGQGLVFSEAFASGTLVVSNPVGIASDLAEVAVTPFAVDQPQALCDSLENLLAHPDWQLQRREAGRDWVAQQTISHMLARYVKLYDRLMD